MQANEDTTYCKLKQHVQEGVVRKYWLDHDLLYARGGRLYVPKGGRLWLDLLKETYDL